LLREVHVLRGAHGWVEWCRLENFSFVTILRVVRLKWVSDLTDALCVMSQ
jgi:hypothetical protein